MPPASIWTADPAAYPVALATVHWVPPMARVDTVPDTDVGLAGLLPVLDRSPNRLSSMNPWMSRKFGPPKENVASAGPMISLYKPAIVPRSASSGRNFGVSSGA